MAENDNTPSLGGFDLDRLSSMLTGEQIDEGDGRADGTPPMTDPKVIKQALKDEDEEKNENEEANESTEEDTSDSGDSSDGGDVDSTDNSGGDSGSDDQTAGDEADSADVGTSNDVDLGEYEQDITGFLNERFKEELGWKLDDEDAPKDIGEFVEFMKNIVDEASKPVYSSDEVKAFDEFVKNGGNLRDFYSTAVEGRVDTEAVNMESSFDQKLVLREHYTNQGYGEDRINKMLKRFEDAGILEEEASDALELLKDYNEKTKQRLLEKQKKDAAVLEEQQQKFVEAVEDSIKSLNDIRGVKISEKEKKELLDYILVPDGEGYTQYQREYMSNIKNLLESAYFTKKGDVLINKSKAQGKSDAVKNLHDKLKANKGNKAKQSGDQSSGKTSSGLSLLGSMLQGS